ncbi:hypothetical protein ACFQX6_00840 [Streptosporangium lutulentum]
MRDPQDSQPAVMPHEPVGSSPRHFPPPPRPAPQIVPAPPGSRYDLMGRTPCTPGGGPCWARSWSPWGSWRSGPRSSSAAG